MRRSPDSVSRPTVSISPSASRACTGWVSMTRRAAPACRAMTPMLCATMSCSSRAMRSRSSVTTWAAA